jgi:hypothetical protein
MVAAGLMVVVGVKSWANGAEAGDEGQADRYVVPDGDVAELAEFIEQLTRYRPTTPKEDLMYRAKCRPALQQAAERIIRLEGDPSSDACQAARFVLLTNRLRAFAQAAPQEQRKLVADVKNYVTEKAKAGQAGVAANLATFAGQCIERTGQYQLAADSYRGLAKVLAEADGEKLSDQIENMEASAQRVDAVLEEIPPRGLGIELPPRGTLIPVDIWGKSNAQLDDLSGPGSFEGNGFAELQRGEQTLGGVLFKIGDRMIQLGSTNLPDRPPNVEGILLNRHISRLFILHGTQWGSPNSVQDGTPIGEYKVHYDDGSTASMPIVFGQDVRDWWNWDRGRPVTRGRVVWTGGNLVTDKYEVTLRLYLGVWQNPHPEKRVESVDFITTKDTICAPFCVAMTVEEAT